MLRGKHASAPCGCATRQLVTILAATVVICFAASAKAQTYTVIHNFTGGADGGYPDAGVTIDRNGNLYGTAFVGGLVSECEPWQNGCGVVFELKRQGSGWIFSQLYAFLNNADGQGPYGRVVIGPDGTLYGTTFLGGGSTNCTAGCGTAFQLRPPATVCRAVLCQWDETVLYRFSGHPDLDGASPLYDLSFDSAGNIYGITNIGGTADVGTVYKLTHSGSGWSESVLYSFSGGEDGYTPGGDITFDAAGNIYGTTEYGGRYNMGVVYQLAPSASGWTDHTLHDFQNAGDGEFPVNGVIFDGSGELLGATTQGGVNNGGLVYQLTPTGASFASLLNLADNYGAYGKLYLDNAGNVYGTTYGSGTNGDYGTAFKLTQSNGVWTETVLHRFNGAGDGAYPVSNLILDASGNIYGTTTHGGAYGYGVVFEITP